MAASIEKLDAKFGLGSKIVYPSHGLGVIEQIEDKTIAGSCEACYVIRFHASGMTITAPVRGADSVGMRRIIRKQDVPKVMKILRDETEAGVESNWNKRQKTYLEKIKSGSIYEVAAVYRDLRSLRNGKGLSFGEQQVFDNAHKLIVSEIAEAKGLTEEKVVKLIDDTLDN